MSQRVTLTYSVEMDELEFEVHRLLKSALSRLRNSYPEPSSKEEVVLSAGVLEEITALRAELGHIDIMLGDVAEIIRSYLHYKTQAATSTPLSPATLGDTLSHLQTLAEHMTDESNPPEENSTQQKHRLP